MTPPQERLAAAIPVAGKDSDAGAGNVYGANDARTYLVYFLLNGTLLSIFRGCVTGNRASPRRESRPFVVQESRRMSARGGWTDEPASAIRDIEASLKTNSHPTSERFNYGSKFAASPATKRSKLSSKQRYDATNNCLLNSVVEFECESWFCLFQCLRDDWDC
jgi:hypothetical protein